MPTGLLRESLKNNLQRFKESRAKVDCALGRLRDQKGTYAKEHLQLVKYYSDLIKVTEERIEKAKQRRLFG